MVTMVKNKKLLDDKALLASRRAWVDEISKLTSAHLKALPALTDDVAAAAVAVEVTKAAHAKAVAEHRTAAGRASVASLRFSRSRDLLEAQLRDSAPAEIGAFIDEMKVEEARLQLTGNPNSVADRQARAADLRDARLQVEALRLQPLTPAELAERLDEIRDRAVDEVGS